MKFRLAGLALLLMLLTACATTTDTRPSTPVTATPSPAAAPPRAKAKCPDCGRIERIDTVQGVRATARGGVVLGGVVGGVVSAEKKKTPSPAPAVATKTYRLVVRMDDGRRLVMHQNVISPNLRIGSIVRVSNGRVMLLR